jgi:putative DNA primase/helicase
MSREESFRAAMSTHGIEYSGELYFDGRLHRFKADGDNARNSWYVLYNGLIAAGAFGCWKRGIKEAWCERNGSLSLADSQRIRARWQEKCGRSVKLSSQPTTISLQMAILA